MPLVQTIKDLIRPDLPLGGFEVRTKVKSDGSVKTTVTSKACVDVDDPRHWVAKEQAEALRKALKPNVVLAATRLDPAQKAPEQWLQLGTGHGAIVSCTPESSLIIPTVDQVFDDTKASGSTLKSVVAPLLRLGRGKRVEPQSKPGKGPLPKALAHVPHNLFTRQERDRHGTVFQVHDGQLHRFDAAKKRFTPVDATHEAKDAPFSSLTVVDGQAWAVRGGNELVRIDNDGKALPTLTAVVEHDADIVCVSPTLNGRLGFVDTRGDLMDFDGTGQPHKGSVRMTDGNGATLDGVRALAISINVPADGGAATLLVAGNDGRLYTAFADGEKGAAAFVAEPLHGVVPTGHQLVALSSTQDKESNVSHVVIRDEFGGLYSKFLDGSDFRNGWRFDKAHIFTNQRGLVPDELPAKDVVCINQEGLCLGVRDNRLLVHAPRGQWTLTELQVQGKPKSNPTGWSFSYARVDNQIVRLAVSGFDPVVPLRRNDKGQGEPFFRGVHDALGVKKQEVLVDLKDEAAAVVDFAALESGGEYPGDDTRVVYHVDTANRVFKTDLSGSEPQRIDVTPPQVPPGMGAVKQLALDRAGTLFALAEVEGQAPRLYRLRPGTPAMAAKPGTPAVPAVPPTPAVAAKPGRAPVPATATTPAVPGMPATPAVPAKPGKPAVPAKPGTPAQAAVPPQWEELALSLGPDDRVQRIETSWMGRLHVAVERQPTGLAASTHLYQFDASSGLSPMESSGAREALIVSGGTDVAVSQALPVLHVGAEVLGLRTNAAFIKRGRTTGEVSEVPGLTTQVPKSTSPGWLKSAAMHMRSLKAGPKALGNYVNHKSNGWDALNPLYRSVAQSGATVRDALRAGTPSFMPPGGLDAAIATVAEGDGALKNDMKAFCDELILNTRQLLEHVGRATGFLDANMKPVPGFKPARQSGPDLVADLSRWLKTANLPAGEETTRMVQLLDKMGGAGGKSPLMLSYPDVAGTRDCGDRQSITKAQLLKNVEALQAVASLFDPAKPATTQPFADAFEVIRNDYKDDPVNLFSKAAFQNMDHAERAQDILAQFSKHITKKHHPVYKTVAAGLGVKGVSARRNELIRQAKAGTLDPVLMHKFDNAATQAIDSPQALQRALTDKNDPDYKAVNDVLHTETRVEMKNKFVDAILGMKAKEIFVVDRSYKVGLDPLAYIYQAGLAYAFAGGMVGRDYNFYVEVLGDDPRGGALAFVLDKSAIVQAEVSAGVGFSGLHGPGFFDHWMRAAAFAEIGYFGMRGGGPLFIAPRDKLTTFVDKLFEFSAQPTNQQSVPRLLQEMVEKEHADHTLDVGEIKVQTMLRGGASGYHPNAGGDFWATRPSLFQMAFGLGGETEAYHFSGTMLNGEAQPGFELHSYIASDIALGLPGMRVRNWFNEPTPETEDHQLALGVGNTDNEFQVSTHDKKGHKVECRMTVPDPVSQDQWIDALGSFEAHGNVDLKAQFTDIQTWHELGGADFNQRVKALQASIKDWPCNDIEKGGALEALDVLRHQHVLAKNKLPQIVGIIDETRMTNPSDLLQVGTMRKFAEKLGLLKHRDPTVDPLCRLHQQIQSDPTLKTAIKGLIEAHPTRIKFKCEMKPEAMERLVTEQLKNLDDPTSPVFSVDYIKAQIADPANTRVRTITALRGNEVDTGFSLWPLVGFAGRASVTMETNEGALFFKYGPEDSSTPIALAIGAGENRRLQKLDAAWSVPHADDHHERRMRMEPVPNPFSGSTMVSGASLDKQDTTDSDDTSTPDVATATHRLDADDEFFRIDVAPT
jgi:hypothetical protein